MAEVGACGCCAGAAVSIPAAKANPPGQPALSYRAGTHAMFLESLIARLSSRDYPALARLTTRLQPERADRLVVPEDWTLGLLDAFAVLADVITFYQERIANEAFLRTAVEASSVRELARLVGYELAPGVAASTSLAFTLAVPRVPGAPLPLPVTIPPGTRVQSVPGPDEAPQPFETVAEIVARAEWNELQPELFRREPVTIGQTSLWLAGVATQLQQGDTLLLVGAEREATSSGDAWEVRQLEAVEVDPARNVTRVRWSAGLSKFAASDAANAQAVRCYALRQRAALFGHNAPDPTLITLPAEHKGALVTKTEGKALVWVGFEIGSVSAVDLDAVYPKVVRGSWVVFRTVGSEVETVLSRADAVEQMSIAQFGIAAKVTRLGVADAISGLDRRSSVVFVQSELLDLTARPLSFPVFGARFALSRPDRWLRPGQSVAVSGKRARVVVTASTHAVSFLDDLDRRAVPGETFIVLEPPRAASGTLEAITPEDFDNGSDLKADLQWKLLDRDGTTIQVEAGPSALQFVPAQPEDETVRELARIAEGPQAIVHTPNVSTLTLTRALARCYDRSSVRVNANVAPATHGETVAEVVGSGDAASANQRFSLRQAPLTYVAAAGTRGRKATLELRVNELRWQEVPTLFGCGPTDRVYALRQIAAGQTVVQFGNGVEGARLPTGSNNLRASYRRGIGTAGDVRAGTLTTLISRPLGVEAVVNPEAAGGAEDPESLRDARRNAPSRMLTLDRAVSVIDYADFARAFAGITKAVASWNDGARTRGIYVTVAAVGRTELSADTAPLTVLADALRRYGDRLLSVTVRSFKSAKFRLKAGIQVADGYEPTQVVADVTTAVRDAFGFASRDFGQAVTIDEVMSVVHRVEGVSGVDVDRFHRADVEQGAQPAPRIFPLPSRVDLDGTMTPAELLTLDDDTLELEWRP